MRIVTVVDTMPKEYDLVVGVDQIWKKEEEDKKLKVRYNISLFHSIVLKKRKGYENQYFVLAVVVLEDMDVFVTLQTVVVDAAAVTQKQCGSSALYMKYLVDSFSYRCYQLFFVDRPMFEKKKKQSEK